MRKATSIASIILASFLTACSFQSTSTNTLAPSSTSPATNSAATSSMLGTWTSQSTTVPSTSSCGAFSWIVTSQTETTLAGNFGARCSGGITVSGTASGQLNGNLVPIVATGTATAPDGTTCSFSLSGTGTVQANTMTVPYTGTTCLGPVQGTEVLHRP